MRKLIRNPVAYARLTWTFLVALALSAWDVLKTVLARRLDIHPAIIAFPLALRDDGDIALLANLVSLTPGTTALHVADDRRTLYVHVMNARDADAIIADIRTQFESRIQRAAA